MDMIRGKTLDNVTAVIWFFHSEPWRKLKIQCPSPSFSVGIVLRSSAKSFTMHFIVLICISLLKSESRNSLFMLFNWYCCISFFYENLYNAVLFVPPLSEDFYTVQLRKSKQYCGICKNIWHHSDGGDWVRFLCFDFGLSFLWIFGWRTRINYGPFFMRYSY